ncbi:MAG: flagellar assembly protein FliW [Bdellovibrionaceae bacterium]|nr:flagellar assembly protein FliW [Pseudobdellovibrionaceae bacterium]MBX3032793.1 flagellar assembly protein FliW [Pseudobdellovibrionaceae bacterium]
MIIETSRFGRVSLNAEDLLTFPEGLLGFADLRSFVLLDDPSDEIFAWLQSCESPAIAFPVLEPELFNENYRLNLTKSDLEALRLASMKEARAFSIITVPEDPTLMTANLKAPIVINVKEKTARQCVLQDNNLAIREPIFSKLQQRVVSNPTVSIKGQSAGMDVATPLRAADSGQGV